MKKTQYDNRPYHRITMMGDKIETVERVIYDYWRERFFINNAEKTVYKLMDRSFRLIFLIEEDVDWESVKTLEYNSNHWHSCIYFNPVSGKIMGRNGKAAVECCAASQGTKC